MAPLSRAEYTRRVLILLALAVGMLALWRIAGFLLLGFGGVVFAIVIRAAARGLSRHLPIPIRWATGVVVLALAGLLLFFMTLFGDELTRQLRSLYAALPELVARVRQVLQSSEAGRAVSSLLASAVNEQVLTGLAMRGASLLFSAMSDLLIVSFIGLYLSFSPRSYLDASLAMVPPRHRPTVRETLSDSGDSLRRWLLGQLVSMGFVAVLTGIGLWLVGVPNALGLAVLAGLLDFIPVLGPFLAAIPGVLLASTAGPAAALYAAGVYLIVQQLESALIMPLAQKWAVELPPVVGLLAVLVFGAIFGVPGLLFGVPLTVVIMVWVRRFYLERMETSQPSAPSSSA